MKIKIILLLIGLITLIYCALHGCAKRVFEPEIDHPNGKIAYISDRDGNHEIYIMNIDGSDQINLTKNEEEDNHPNFSPDGSKIAFYSRRTGNGEIYTMNIDGSKQINLTNNEDRDRNPIFPP